jgi:hypothetical protein
MVSSIVFTSINWIKDFAHAMHLLMASDKRDLSASGESSKLSFCR